MPSCFATVPTARMKPEISASDAVALKSAKEQYFPFGITSTCSGACGAMSWKASAQASS